MVLESPVKSNPWLVQSFQEFIHYCCPKCECRKKSIPEFVAHVTKEHKEGANHIRLLFEKEIVPKIDVKIEDLEEASNDETHVIKQEILHNPGLDFEDPLSLPSIIPTNKVHENNESPDLSENEDNFDENKTIEEFADDDCNADLSDHLETEGNENEQPKKVVKIPILAKKSLSKNKRNTRIKTDEKIVHDCKQCGKTCPTKSKLDQHVRAKHLKIKPFKCEQCEKTFGWKEGLKTHVDHVHSKLREHVCEECGNSFTTKQSLLNHLQSIHRGIPLEKKHKCEQCEKRFQTPGELNEHIKVKHDNLIQYFCEFCPKQFKRKKEFKQHVNRAHLGMKIPCETCGKEFMSNAQMKRHVKSVHEKRFIFPCSICQRSFNRIHILQNHIDKIHKVKITYSELRQQMKDNPNVTEIF